MATRDPSCSLRPADAPYCSASRASSSANRRSEHRDTSTAGTSLPRKTWRLADTASALASAVTGEFGLVGVNGIDFIVRDGIPYAIEVNPRWCASMELVERA